MYIRNGHKQLIYGYIPNYCFVRWVYYFSTLSSCRRKALDTNFFCYFIWDMRFSLKKNLFTVIFLWKNNETLKETYFHSNTCFDEANKPLHNWQKVKVTVHKLNTLDTFFFKLDTNCLVVYVLIDDVFKNLQSCLII